MDKYQQTIDWLFEQFPSYQVIGSKAYKPTLENIEKILQRLDHPEKELKFVHVAGSNGKGSVCSIVASSLTEAGYTVGLFTSPHIKDFTERIRVNGEPINEEKVIQFVERLKRESFDFSPSFFEITFALALEYFKEMKCDICVIETGLGGRLDATNVITPLISAITSISLEHTDILGDTIEEIAYEKAGIIKAEIPVVIGRIDDKAEKVISQKAAQLNAELFHSSSNQVPEAVVELLLAEYQFDNFSVAHEILNQLKNNGFNSSLTDMESGIRNIWKNTGYQGRLQVINEKPLTILDVSHNADGFKSTFEAVNKANNGELHIVIGTSADKDLKKVIEHLPTQAKYYVTEFMNMRSEKLHNLRHIFGQSNLESIRYFKEPEKAFELASFNAEENDTILVIGSFFLLEHFF